MNTEPAQTHEAGMTKSSEGAMTDKESNKPVCKGCGESGLGCDQFGCWKTGLVYADDAAESLPPEPAQEEVEEDEESLKPCPFCGSNVRWGESPDGGHFIECGKCQASTNLTYYLMDDASRDVRERWNRRVK